MLCSFSALFLSVVPEIPVFFKACSLISTSADVMHSAFMSSYTLRFSKIPDLLSLALNRLLGIMSLFITAYYACILGHFTYTSNSTGLKLNSLFPYICSFSFVPYLLQGAIFPVVIQYGNMSLQILPYFIPISKYL